MHLSKKGIELIKRFEGFSSTIYKCPAGYPTIGYGHLVKKGEKFGIITFEEGAALLLKDVQFAVDAVRRLVKVPLTQNQFDALVSFVYNVGEGNFASSTLLRLLNEGQYNGAAVQFPRWNKAGGKALVGLTRRREAEQKLFERAA